MLYCSMETDTNALEGRGADSTPTYSCPITPGSTLFRAENNPFWKDEVEVGVSSCSPHKSFWEEKLSRGQRDWIWQWNQRRKTAWLGISLLLRLHIQKTFEYRKQKWHLMWNGRKEREKKDLSRNKFKLCVLWRANMKKKVLGVMKDCLCILAWNGAVLWGRQARGDGWTGVAGWYSSCTPQRLDCYWRSTEQ